MRNLTMKNKKILATMGAIIGTMIVLILLAPKIKTKLIGDVETVYQLKSDLQKGEKISENNIVESEVNKSYIPKSAVRNKKEIIGKYAKTDIFKYDYVTKEKLSNDDVFYDGENSLISLTIQTPTAGVSGKLQKGDIVRVLGYNQNNEDSGVERVVEYPELRAVEVVSITTSNLQEADKIGKSDEISPSDLPSTVVLKVKNESQLSKIIELEYGAKAHLAFLARGKNGEKLLKDQERLIKKLLENEITSETSELSINSSLEEE